MVQPEFDTIDFLALLFPRPIGGGGVMQYDTRDPPCPHLENVGYVRVVVFVLLAVEFLQRGRILRFTVVGHLVTELRLLPGLDRGREGEREIPHQIMYRLHHAGGPLEGFSKARVLASPLKHQNQ